MKNIFITIAFSVSLLWNTSIFSQNWKKTFTYPQRDVIAYSITESYDHGILFLSNFLKNGDNLHTGWLIKTDVNGNKLWERVIGNYDGYESAYEKIVETSDKGFIIPGSWSKEPYSNSPDPLFLKFNACGNLEWCMYFKTDDHMDFGVDVIEISDGYIGLMWYYGNDYATQRIALTKLDFLGNVQWTQIYHSDSALNELGHSIILRSDGKIMVTGECRVLKPNNPYQQFRPLFITVEPTGTLINYGILDVSDTLWSYGWETRESPYGDYYTAGGVLITPPYAGSALPYLLKTNQANSEILLSKILLDTTQAQYGGTNFIKTLNDTSLVITYKIQRNSPPSIYDNGILISDTLGNTKKIRALLSGQTNELVGAIESMALTQDQKILAASQEWQDNYIRTVLFKLNSNLEDDSIYTAPYTYDWACPGGVDTVLTIDPDCGVYVDIDELERLPDVSEIKISPNPVSDMLTVSLPEYLVSRNAQRGMQASVYIRNYQKDARLEIYTINGTLQCIQPLAPGQREAQFNTGKLSSGIYFVRMIYQNRQISTVKFVKE